MSKVIVNALKILIQLQKGFSTEGEGEGQRKRQNKRDRIKNRESDRQTDRKKDRQKDTGRETETETGRAIKKVRNKETVTRTGLFSPRVPLCSCSYRV